MGRNKKKKQKVKNETPKIKKINFDYYVGGDLNCCPICGHTMKNMLLEYKKENSIKNVSFKLCDICQKHFYTYNNFKIIPNKILFTQQRANDKVCIFDNYIFENIFSKKAIYQEIIPDIEYTTKNLNIIFEPTCIKIYITSKNYGFNVFCSEKNYNIALKKIKKRSYILPEMQPKSKKNTVKLYHRTLHSYAGLHSNGVNFSTSSKIKIDENTVKEQYKKVESKHEKDTPKIAENFDKPNLLKTNKKETILATNKTSAPPQTNKSNPVKTLDTKNKTVHLYIFRGYLTLSRERLRDYNLIVYDFIHNSSYEIFVTYDFISGKIYMSYEQYLYYRKYRLNAIFTMTNAGTQLIDVYDNFSSVSELALYGYSVGYTSYLTEYERHKILAYLIDNNIMKPYSIISHLQGQIRLKEKIEYKDYSRAIREWKNDIRFVDSYSKKSGKIETKSATIKEDYFIIED